MNTVNLSMILALIGIVGFTVFYLVDVGKKRQKLKELEIAAKKKEVVTTEITKERDPGETEKDLDNGTF